MTGLLGALAEAWGQVRVRRVRFVLSLLGVFVAVFAMTSATAVGRMGQQMVNEAFEAAGGRSATIEVNVTAGPDGEPSPRRCVSSSRNCASATRFATPASLSRAQ